MRLDININVHVHGRGNDAEIVSGLARVLKAIDNLRRNETHMNQDLNKVVSDIAPRLTAIETTTAAIGVFIQDGVKGIVAAAVTKALADNDVAEGEVAATVNAALTDVEQHLQPLMDAITANTPDSGTPLPPVVEPLPADPVQT